MASELEELTKAAGESLLFDMNFENKLVPGESVASVQDVTSSSSGYVEGSTNLTIGTTSYSGNLVQIRISDGTTYEVYTIRVTILTNLNNIRIGEGLLKIVP